MPVRGLTLLALLVGCTGDVQVTKQNNKPEATITYPLDGDSVQEGFSVTFRGTISDTNNTYDELVATWFSGSEELCAEAPITSSGETTCDAVLGLDDTDIILEGRDPENASGVASISLTVVETAAPTVDITAPDGLGTYYSDQEIAFTALVGDAEDAADVLSVIWTDETGAELDIDTVVDPDGTLSGSILLDAGDHAITLSATDSTGKIGSATVELDVNGPNNAPTCAITAPADGAGGGEGNTVRFAGTVTDADVDEDMLLGAWSSNVDGALGSAYADADGVVSLDVDTLSFGVHTITLTGTDEVGATCTDTITYTIGAAPDVSIDLPTDGDLYNEGEEITFLGTVSDDGTSSSALSISWESDIDGVLATAPANSSGETTFTAAWLSVGTHELTLTATDADGLSTSASAFFIVNGLPEAPTVTISPASPSGDDALVANITVAASDPELDPISYSYAWYVDGALSSYTTSTIPASATTRGQVWEVYATPNDGYGDGVPGTDSVTVLNSAPTLASATLSPDPAYEDDTLTCTAGATADADGDSVSVSYAWTVDGLGISPTTASINDTWWARGDVVACTITPTDGTTAGTALTSNAVTISNSIPTIATVAITPVAPEATDTLTCTASGFSDRDGDSDQSTYEWTIEGVYAGSGTTLSATFNGGDDIICTVTPYDGVDYGTPVSDTVTIDNTPPVLASATLTPSSPAEADILACTPGTTTDVDGTTSFSYSYRWTINSATISETSSSLDGSAFDKGDVIRCQVTPNDGTDDGSAVSSNAVTAINTAPEVTSVTLAPSSPDTDDTITATVSTYDIDGDSVSLSYAWYVNGTRVGGSTSTLAGTYFIHSDNVYVDVTPNDGSVSGTTYTSSDLTVANTLPTISSVSLTPTTAYEASTLTCAPTGTDLDSDTISYTYRWTVNGSTIAPTTSTLTGTYFNKASTVSCTVTPADSYGSGTAVTSNTVTISNTAPTLASATLTPTTAYEADTLTCTPGSTSDADGDAVTLSYAWYVNSALISQTSTTLSGTYFSRGNTVYCSVTPTDGSNAGTAMSSSVVTISNTLPVTSAVALTPTTAYEASTLTCTPTSSDADGDTISYTYAWYVNSSAISQTSSTLTGTYFSSGNTVYCRATPADSSGAGTAVSSNTVTITNTVPVLSAVSLTPALPAEGSTLTCAPTASDADGDTISYTYAWYVNSSAIAATSSTLTGTYFSEADVVYCRVTPADSSGSGTAMSSSTVTVGNTAPVMSSVTVTPTTAYEASTLTCTPLATDVDTADTISYTYAWYVNSAVVAATSSTLTGTYFSSGNSVYCRVTPSDGTTSGTAMSATAVTISNTAPVTSAVSLTPTTAYESSTLTCTPTSSDADGDTVSHTYAWYVNGSAISQTSSTLTGTYFSSGNTVYCRATPADSSTSGTAVTSNTVTISNTVPVTSAVALTPTTAYEASTLTCTPTSTDADGDSISYTYAWYVNSSAVAATTSTLTGTYFSSGNTVYCRATPADSSGSGTAVSSNTVTISNTAPVATATLTPTTAYEADTLTCAGSATDADGTTSFTYTYAWYVNSAVISQTTSTLSGTYFSKGNTVYCTVIANDGSTTSSAASSSTVTISNTAPVTSSVSLTPTTAYESSTLTCSPTSSDADGDSISYTYAWYVNSAAVAATSSTLTGTYFSKSNTVYCRVTPTDGSTAGSAVSSSTITISNSTPSTPVVAISPDVPEDTDALVCEVTTTSTDADPADSLNYTFTWTQNGTAFTGATTTTRTGDTVPAASTAEDDIWVCSVTATDGTATSSSATDTVDVLGPIFYEGYDTDLGTNTTIGYNFLFAESFTLASAADLWTMGYIAQSSNTSAFKMAVYSNSAGAPGTLLGYTAAFTPTADTEVDITTAPVTLSAGTYWMVWIVDAANGRVRYTTSGCGAVTTYYTAYAYASAFPTTWPAGASTLTGQCHNIYVGLR